MTFSIYFLCLHPDVFQMLRDEVLSKCGQDSDGEISADTVKNMPYRQF